MVMQLNHLTMWSILLITVLFILNVLCAGDNNFARGKTAHQSTAKLAASRATDGDLTTITSTKKNKNNWWRVDLEKNILFKSVKVYVRNGTSCMVDGVTNSNCSSRLREVYFLTSESNTSTNPNKDNNDWSICSYSITSQGDEYTRSCDRGLTNPLTRQFSIFTTAVTIIELREVEVYGYELPQLSADIDIKADAVTSNSITISFLQWTQDMIGGLPPTKYQVKASDSGGTKTVQHDTASPRLSVEFTGLDAGKSYTFTVSCFIQRVSCSGDAYSIEISTDCVVPGVPGNITFTFVEVTNNGRQRWRYTAFWQVPSGYSCGEKLKYRYRLGDDSLSAKQETRSAVFYVDGDKRIAFRVRAENSAGHSELKSKIDRSEALEPQFKSHQPTLTAINTSCVNLSWAEPAYPGGQITQYQHKCDGGNETEAPNTRSVILCGYQPYTSSECQLRALNSAGWGSSETVTTFTHCAAPVFMEAPMAEESYDSEAEKRRIDVTVKGVIPQCVSLLPLEYQTAGRIFSTSSTIRDLDALTLYNVTIRATNNDGFSSISYIVITTGELAPSSTPVLGAPESVNKSCVVAGWREPDQPNGVITEYEYRCAKYENGYQNWINTTENILKECGYAPGNLVKCKVRAATAIGAGPAEEFFVNITCDYPSPPSFFLVSTGASSDMTFIHIYLEESEHNCRSFKDYTIIIADPDGHQLYSTTNATAGNITVQGALPFTNYSVTITAINDDDLMTAEKKQVITAETKTPEEPKVELYSNTSCVRVGLEKPDVPNGVIINYKVSCSDSNTLQMTEEVKAEDSAAVEYCLISSATLVECLSSATNSVGQGKESVDRIYTQLKLIASENSRLEETSKRGNGLHIKIKRVEVENGDISSYLVLISKQPAQRVKRNAADCGCTKESVSQRYVESMECYCYTTAELTAEEVGEELVFTIGDGEAYGGYLNVELEVQAEYDVYIAVKVDTEEGFDPLIQLYPDFISVTVPKDQSGVIAGATVGGIALAALVLLVIFIILRRLRNQPSKEEDSVVAAHEMADSLADPPAVHVTEAEDNYENLGEVQPPRTSESIPVERLEWYTRTNKAAIRDQYKRLNALSAPQMDVARQPQNKGKCRYLNLYPADGHRVKLAELAAGQTDFINASFLKGYERNNQYIAAQGPFTNETVKDFWQMIWEQRPAAIVMVTNTVENSKVKCMQYWPLKRGVIQSFGGIQVSLKRTEMFSEFAMNHLEVCKNGERRVIPHFYYLSWPDHGVPDIEMFLSFHRLVTAAIRHGETQPLLVHCSAGVGRTGTYIALDYLLDQAKAEGVVGIFECLKEMRSRRPCMIQTLDQYELLHDALCEALATQNFLCRPTEVESKVMVHKTQANSKADTISSEFEHAIRRAAALNHSYAAGKDPQNQHKNRFSEILPAKNAILYLTAGVNGPYINALTVDGYKRKKQWIVTQLPLSNTIADFWQLVLENDISIIIQLDTSPTAFYPNKDSMILDVEPFLITRKSSTNGDAVKIIDLQLETVKKSREVQVLVTEKWPAEDLPNTSHIISLQELPEKLKQEAADRRMCVTCMDGSTKCGIYVCAYNAIEKLKTEQVVDIYTATVMAKMRRPQFISTIEEYGYLYEILRDYLGAFGEYANFG